MKDKMDKNTNVGTFLSSLCRQTNIEIRLLIEPIKQKIMEHIESVLFMF